MTTATTVAAHRRPRPHAGPTRPGPASPSRSLRAARPDDRTGASTGCWPATTVGLGLRRRAGARPGPAVRARRRRPPDRLERDRADRASRTSAWTSPERAAHDLARCSTPRRRCTFGTADRRKADVAEGVALAVGAFAARRGNRLGLVHVRRPVATVVTPPAGGRVGHARPAPRDRAQNLPRRAAAPTSPARCPGASSPRSATTRRRSWSSSPTSAARATGRRPLPELAGRHHGHRRRDPRPARAGARRRRRAAPRRPRDRARRMRVDTGDARSCATAFAAAAAADRASLAAAFRRLAVRPPAHLDGRSVAAITGARVRCARRARAGRIAS